MAITLGIQLTHTAVAPGGRLEGHVSLIIPSGSEVESAVLPVFWRTEGRGTTDEGIAVTEALPLGGAPSGGQIEHSFSVNVPRIPGTYYGRLIKIHWYASVYVKPVRGREAGQEAEFVLHPTPDYSSNAEHAKR